ncbi:cadherin-related family member 5 isoform 1-T1 [Synchiropus picturatus]
MTMRLCRFLLLQVALKWSYNAVKASLCLGGSDIFASVAENSPMGHVVANISINGYPAAAAVRLCLNGKDADWFFLQDRTVRLNSSDVRVLDREVLGAILIAELTCYENNIRQCQYRILVEILNENDNKPSFLNETIQPVTISELTAVDSVVINVKAHDEDGDAISYIIDQSSPDASFFRIDLPNSGNVLLNKPLDYETKATLRLNIWAMEANSVEKYNITAALTVNIADGDDQYPRFLPCTPLAPGVPACASPTYSANVTETQEGTVLEFSPGPVRAEDGDRGLNTAVVYTILSGDDQGRFAIDNQTGDIRLTRAVGDKGQSANFQLTVMVPLFTSPALLLTLHLTSPKSQASQLDDWLKYSVASVLVRVLRNNKFPPVFRTTTYKGFVVQSSSSAAIVSGYGNRVLVLHAYDQDFSDGVNPNIRYSIRPPATDRLFHVTQSGVLIARADQLQASSRSVLQVIARDEESGEEVSASVDVEVLQQGQAVPGGTFMMDSFFMDVDIKLVGFIAIVVLLLFLCALLFLFLRTAGKQPQPDVAEAENLGKRREVTSGQTAFKRSSFGDMSTHEYESSASFHGRHGIYTRRQSYLPPPSTSSTFVIMDREDNCDSPSGPFPVLEDFQAEKDELEADEGNHGGAGLTDLGHSKPEENN